MMFLVKQVPQVACMQIKKETHETLPNCALCAPRVSGNGTTFSGERLYLSSTSMRTTKRQSFTT